MQKTFTPELLAKHLYNETNEQESISVKNALASNEKLRQEFNRLQETKQALDEAGGDSPDFSVIEIILAYSKEQELTEVH